MPRGNGLMNPNNQCHLNAAARQNALLGHIHVACAIIELGGKVLCTQRSASMSMPLKWEFPGGKINDGESPEECLRRELIEELGVEISAGEPLPTTIHHYPTFSITLYPFVCEMRGGRSHLRG